MRKINYVQRFATGYLANGISDNGVSAQIALIEIRGAVVKPVEDQPGYYLYFGMMKEPNIYSKYPIMFLAEGTATTYADLITKLMDDASRLKASVLYAEMPREKKNAQGFYRDLWNFRYKNCLPCQIKPAVSANDHEYGMALVQEWSKEKSIIRPQLVETVLTEQIASERGMVEGVDLKAPDWYAFHALRYLLAGFVKNPPQPVAQMTKTGWGDKYDSTNILGRESNGRSLAGWT